MKRAIVIAAFSSLLILACNNGSSSSSHNAKSDSIGEKITTAFKKGAKHRTTSISIDKKQDKSCVETELAAKGGKGDMSKEGDVVKIQSEETRKKLLSSVRAKPKAYSKHKATKDNSCD